MQTATSGVGRVTCMFSTENCLTFIANVDFLQLNLSASSLVLPGLCDRGSRSFELDESPRIQAELALLGWNASCPELQVTDQWGFF
eukprot:3647047-Rhodomonas_salina.1